MQTTQSPQIAVNSSPKRARNLALKMVLVTAAVAWLGLVAASWADAAEINDRGSAFGVASERDPGAATAALPASVTDEAREESLGWRASRAPAGIRQPASAADGDDYNFNWLDPEKKIYVLQNRRYTKAGRALVTAMVGPGFSNPYRQTYNFDPRLAYYFTESLGVEGFFTLTSNQANSVYDALVGSAGNTRPVIREIQNQAGGLVHWVPWYAKINVFNQILYFDWYFSAGAGQMSAKLESYDKTANKVVFADEKLLALYLGTGHQYHLGHHLLVRLDFMTGIYKATIGDSAGTKALFSNNNFAIGLGLKL